jgi:trimeric autotransporter adhesin
MAMTNESEPRALSAALSAPAFVTRGHGMALHAANRHVERWAPEASASQVRPMRTLGFVDRMVAPWLETAQRSASLRLFSQYAASGLGPRDSSAVSWVFPRPWYQDELDWMAAARQAHDAGDASAGGAPRQAAPRLLTTRGTYVRPEIAAPRLAMPTALYEYVAPSLSLAGQQPAPIAGVGFGGETLARGEAYSPLVSLASVQAADLMSRAVAPLAVRHAADGRPGTAPGAPNAPSAMTPGLRSVLTAILERAAAPRVQDFVATRSSRSAPELVTPPHPSLPVALAGSDDASPIAGGGLAGRGSAAATQIAEQYAAQRVQIVELQRVAQHSAQRELAARAAAIASLAASEPARPPAPGAAEGGAGAALTTRVAASGRAAGVAASTEALAAIEASRSLAQDSEARATAERAAAEAAERGSSSRPASGETHIAERARVEQLVAQRIAERASAERVGGARLHEQARTDAAAHARTQATPVRPTADVDVAASPAPRTQAAAEVTTAIAGLSPELAALLGGAVSQRPERALQAIRELGETLRTVELLARSSAAGVTFEATRGPRLVMPAGLGGLVSAVDRAQAISDRPMLGGPRPLAALPQLVDPQGQLGSPAQQQADRARGAARVPALSWLSAAAPSARSDGPAALTATTSAAPVALSHVAWADRWLARFAGAAPQSLDMISAAAAAAPASRMQALASAAPGAVFVVPELLRGDLQGEAVAAQRAPVGSLAARASSATAASASLATQPGAGAAGAVPGMRLLNPPPLEAMRRFDDSAETPDEVFAAISAAVSRGRSSRPGAAARAAAAASEARVAEAGAAGERATLADLVAHAAPSAPGAGLSAQLAASPFAPALRHVLPLPSAASFDVRSLFGAGLGATYLAGLLGSSAHGLEIGTQLVPTWASWSEAPLAMLGAADRADGIDRIVPAFDAAYVHAEAPERPSADQLQEPSGDDAPSAVRLAAAARAVAAVGALASTAPASTASTSTASATGAADPGMLGEPGAAGSGLGAAASAGSLAALTTLRSALLSWEMTTAAALGAQPSAPLLAPAALAASASHATPYAELTGASIARIMIDAMSSPMLSDTVAERAPWAAAPGMLADRAHSWSVAQERSSSDLSLDFVTPELVLAARVYGLGPAEAAQAARLAIAGPGQLGAMASTVDRTFVEALAIGRDARSAEARSQEAGGYQARGAAEARVASRGRAEAPWRARDAAERVLVQGEDARSLAEPQLPIARDGDAALARRPGVPAAAVPAAITTAFPTADGAVAAAIAPTTRAPLPAASGVAFGVDRRSPRGAFLWPSATVAALGMNAAGADGKLSMSVAALELLAAQVVAELGTYTALSDADAAARELAGEAGPAGDGVARAGSAGTGRASWPGAAGPLAALATGPDAAGYASEAGATAAAGARSPVAQRAGDAPRDGALPSKAEPGEADVLRSAAALVPGPRRARFEALYVALSQSNLGRGWSPAARAARALALAGRGEPVVSARERAATAWEVLPVVYPTAAGDEIARADAAMADPADTSTSMTSFAVGASAASGSMASVVAPSAATREPAGDRGPAAARGSAGGGRATGRGQRGGALDLAGPDGSDGFDGLSYVAPGLAGLSARAGAALGAYVSPAAPPSVSPSRSSESSSAGAVLRAPTAAPEYVQTGRSGGRYGGGEVEIPSWFEAAARKMLVERSGDADGISLAELTLVTAAPASHIAASSRGSSGTGSSGPSGTTAAQQAANTPKIDVERLAHDLFRELLTQMDIARERNGDPYQ